MTFFLGYKRALLSSNKRRDNSIFFTILFLFFFHFQKSCIDFAINATPLERYMPEERVGFKYRLWRIVESTPFEYFIMTLIVLNTILLMMKVSIFESRRDSSMSTISFSKFNFVKQFFGIDERRQTVSYYAKVWRKWEPQHKLDTRWGGMYY